MKYSDLVNGLQPLEHKYNGHGTRSVFSHPFQELIEEKNKVQYFVCDCSHVKSNPNNPTGYIPGWPFVEAKLGRERGNLDVYVYISRYTKSIPTKLPTSWTEKFLKLVKYLGLTDWFFTSNLSRRPVF